jgi:hypothetical protein
VANSEFKRNLWLEFTPVRLVTGPAIVGSVALIVYLIQGNSQDFFGMLQPVSRVIAGFTLFLWAMRLASDSILTEVSGRTWVFQRMSAISAWDMTVGKLFGSTVYAWYTTGFFLLAYIICAINSPDTFFSIKAMFLLIFSAVFAHSVSIIMCLMAVRSNRFTGRNARNSVFVFGGGAGLIMWLIAPTFFSNIHFSATWFSWSINGLDFVIISAAVAAFWGLAGLYRNMRTELHYDNGPLVWCAFALFLVVYTNGLAFGSASAEALSMGSIVLRVSFIVFAALFYMALVFEPYNPVIIKKCIYEARNSRWRESLILVPLWVPTFAGLVLIALILIPWDIVNGPQGLFGASAGEGGPSYMPVSALFFVLRDMGVIMLVQSARPKKAGFYIMLYLALVYALVPSVVKLMSAPAVLHFFWPVAQGHFALQVLPAASQCAVILYIVWRRTQRTAAA